LRKRNTPPTARQARPLAGFSFSGENTHDDTIDLFVCERANSGVYDASIDGEPFCRSRTPLLTAARILKSEGAAPETPLAMWRYENATPI
jgi:hypothetical protein